MKEIAATQTITRARFAKGMGLAILALLLGLLLACNAAPQCVETGSFAASIGALAFYVGLLVAGGVIYNRSFALHGRLSWPICVGVLGLCAVVMYSATERDNSMNRLGWDQS